jgi:hypothetical protein
MEHIAVTHFLKVFEKSEEKFEEKKVYTSDGTNASDLITRVLNLLSNVKIICIVNLSLTMAIN